MSDQADEELMAAYQKGDLAAFAELVARHERRLWNFVRRFVQERAAAEDLVQELFLRVIKSAPEWKPTAKVTTWLYAIARNLCIDHARRSVFRRAVSLDGDGSAAGGRGGHESSDGRPLLDRLPGPAVGGERALLDREIAAHIDAAVGALPLEQREVFLMREVMEMPFAEIALAVGAGEPTVKSRMRYALERLRVALDGWQEKTGEAAAERAGQTP
jgi:RNA polymerase sigma-70 factor (ECF subfamily)